ncbi:MAG: glycosyltransferase family 4 protein [Candidatus Buchananbacteria bacterium]
MKILNLSSDKAIINPQSKPAMRMVKYGSIVEKYSIIVLASKDETVSLADNVIAYGVSGNRLSALFKMYRLAKKIIEEKDADVITSQDPFEMAMIGLILSRKHGIGLNIQEHGDFFSAKFWRNENIKNFLRYYLGMFLIPKADSVRAVSERIKNNLIKNLHVEERKITVVPVYVELNRPEVSGVAEIAEKLKGKTVIMTMARLVKQKNLPLMIRSFSDLAEKSSETVLLIIGKGPEKEKLKNLAKDLKQEDRIIFIDWTDDIYSYYDLADIYALSSNYEGWGMVIIEAASCGLPIVITDVGCANEVIKNNESGLIIPIGDREKMASAMSKLISSKELRDTLGATAKKAIINLPDQQRTLELYSESWQKAIKK